MISFFLSKYASAFFWCCIYELLSESILTFGHCVIQKMILFRYMHTQGERRKLEVYMFLFNLKVIVNLTDYCHVTKVQKLLYPNTQANSGCIL